jgi:hypothetical protein
VSDTIALAPLVAWPVIAALAAIATLLAGFALLRGARGAILRALALVVLLAALLEPRLIREKREAQPDLAVVVVDATASQRVGNRAAATAEALARLQDSLAPLPDLETRVITVGDAPAEAATRPFAALEKAGLEEDAHRLAGVVLLTDGQVHDAPGPELPRWLQAPVHVLLTGAPGERDRRVVIEQAPAYGLVGRTVEIAFRVDDLGPRPDARSAELGPVAVSVRSGGAPAGTARVMPGLRHVLPIALNRAGPVAVELSAAAAEGEVSLRNNRAAIVVNAVRERLKVLLVSGQPHPGARAWRNLLKSDPAVDLIHFTILRSAENDEGTPLKELALIVFPVQELFEDRLKDFDLIVFDRFGLRDILPSVYFDNLAEYARGGGAMLVASGPELADSQSLADTGLKDVLPARPTGRIVVRPFKPQISEAGRRHPVTQPLATTAVPAAPAVASPPAWGRWFRLIEANAPAAVTLMTGPDEAPLLVLGRVGEGRVAQVLSDQIWLWARGFEGGGPHAELTRRLVHWLMREPALEEERLSAAVSDGRLVVERHSLSAAAGSVDVTLPDERRLPLALAESADGIARGSLAAEEPGLYRVTDGTREAIAVAGRINADETVDLRATPDRLQATAAASGGWLGWLADGLPDVRRTAIGRDTHGKGWIGLRRTGAEVVRGVTEVPLLPPLAVLGLGLALLSAAWWREGR